MEIEEVLGKIKDRERLAVEPIASRDEILYLCGYLEGTLLIKKENLVLRGLVQTNPDWKCPYGVNHTPNLGMCPSGFPGCACADDRMELLGEYLRKHADG
jgi:hypothetical protein